MRYAADIRNIRLTVPSSIPYLHLLAKHSSASKINILAYSAGATLVSEALAILGEDSTKPDRQAYLSVPSQATLNRVARELNERPCETLEFETPAERFNACVASTG